MYRKLGEIDFSLNSDWEWRDLELFLVYVFSLLISSIILHFRAHVQRLKCSRKGLDGQISSYVECSLPHQRRRKEIQKRNPSSYYFEGENP